MSIPANGGTSPDQPLGAQMPSVAGPSAWRAPGGGAEEPSVLGLRVATCHRLSVHRPPGKRDADALCLYCMKQVTGPVSSLANGQRGAAECHPPQSEFLGSRRSPARETVAGQPTGRQKSRPTDPTVPRTDPSPCPPTLMTNGTTSIPAPLPQEPTQNVTSTIQYKTTV